MREALPQGTGKIGEARSSGSRGTTTRGSFDGAPSLASGVLWCAAACCAPRARVSPWPARTTAAAPTPSSSSPPRQGTAPLDTPSSWPASRGDQASTATPLRGRGAPSCRGGGNVLLGTSRRAESSWEECPPPRHGSGRGAPFGMPARSWVSSRVDSWVACAPPSPHPPRHARSAASGKALLSNKPIAFKQPFEMKRCDRVATPRFVPVGACRIWPSDRLRQRAQASM